MEDVLQQAKEQGLTLVQSDDSGFQQLLSDYTRIIQEAEKLCDVVDDEKTPFASKYQARDCLDQLLRNVEAHHTIASLEKQKEKMMLLQEKMASLQVKIGTISWDCEEPHNAQRELEAACHFYFPTLIEDIHTFIGDREVNQVEDGALHPDVRKQQVPIDFEDIRLPKLASIPLHLVAEAMKTLNLLGILWAGRAQPYKSLHYLLSAHSIHEQYIANEAVPKDVVEDLQHGFTHNLFYLAQAYGNLGNAKKSSYYCQQTLQRQLLQRSTHVIVNTNAASRHLPNIGLNDYKSALEWVKNCCGIADFYLAMNYYQCCALALASAEKILTEKVIKPLYEDMNAEFGEGTVTANNKPNFSSGNINAVEIEADLHRRWAALYITILHRASDREKEIASYQELSGDHSSVECERLRQVEEPGDIEDEQLIQDFLKKTKSSSSQTAEIPSSTSGDNHTIIDFFDQLPVVLPTMLRITSICNFDNARILFLRATAKIEAAKKYFVLDGKLHF